MASTNKNKAIDRYFSILGFVNIHSYNPIKQDF